MVVIGLGTSAFFLLAGPKFGDFTAKRQGHRLKSSEFSNIVQMLILQPESSNTRPRRMISKHATNAIRAFAWRKGASWIPITVCIQVLKTVANPEVDPAIICRVIPGL
ncbi:hypothetical protein L1987_46760 [Smallanthus sonchifolius]|uniref:Uncharacterized protein n=1 Tax=Smallanthus sonchifolius TaxID=185202 RepID=A0ACB9G2E7_9ASTR|nr:hypothetical protein L1987_46760 [Smallanthus sonchifolius]